jgi:AcrR family transcriptional regulator
VKTIAVFNTSYGSYFVSKPNRKSFVEQRINQPNKFVERRKEIADKALEALAKKGYAKTSLRDIAAQADISLGSLSYYFEDKSAMIQYCTRRYKRKFISDLLDLTTKPLSTKEFVDQFIDVFVHAITEDQDVHRLWYDSKIQSLFDETFQNTVGGIEEELSNMVTVVIHHLESLSGKKSPVAPQQAYWLLDGMFQHFLMAGMFGEKHVDEKLQKELKLFFDAVS